MKKTVIILTTILASMILSTGYTFAQYNDGYTGYEDEYNFDSNVYNDDEYWLDNAPDYLDRCQGPVYYFHHPTADVYFVQVGNITFVVSAYEFRPYLYRHNFMMVPRERFISLSCGRLGYNDNYLRFNFYFDFYNRNRWNRRHHSQLRHDYRQFYTQRHRNNRYERNRRTTMQHRSSDRYNYNHSYRGQARQRADGYKNLQYERNRRTTMQHRSSGSYNYNHSYRGQDRQRVYDSKNLKHGNSNRSRNYQYKKSSSYNRKYNKGTGNHRYDRYGKRDRD